MWNTAATLRGTLAAWAVLAVATGAQDAVSASPAPCTRHRLAGEVENRGHGVVGYTHESFQPGSSTTEVWTRGGVPTSGVRYPGSKFLRGSQGGEWAILTFKSQLP